MIHPLPAVDAGTDDSVCMNDVIFLNATGANDFLWAPDSTLNLLNIYNPRATPSSMHTYYVTGTDVYGCRNSDSVTISVLPTYLDSVTAEICDGDSVFVGGTYQTEAGYYTDELIASTGCDSTVVTQVIITGPCPFPSPVVYVDKDAMGLNNGTSWVDAFIDLQDALATVQQYYNVHEIWIAEGTYYPSVSDRDSSFVLTDSVAIYGGFVGDETTLEERTSDPSLVVVSGDIGAVNDSTDNAYHVCRIDPSCVDCRIDGMTVQFGTADFIFNQGYTGAGLYSEGKILLNNCIIQRNTSLLEGSAIYNSGASADMTIKDCIFQLNTSGLERDILNIDGAKITFQGLIQIQD